MFVPQAVLEDNAKKRGELEAKLNHEREKSQNFDRESKDLEKKFAQADKEHQVWACLPVSAGFLVSATLLDTRASFFKILRTNVYFVS